MWYQSKKDDLDLVFIYDGLMTHEEQERIKLVLNFVGFAYITDYKLFTYRKSVVAMHQDDAKGYHQNDKVFGSVYEVPQFSYNALMLDGYYYCSMARIGVNSKHDMRMRKKVACHLFEIDTLDELVCHKYNVIATTRAWVYLGNPLDYKLKRHIDYGRYRLLDGIDKHTYNKLLIERGIVKGT